MTNLESSNKFQTFFIQFNTQLIKFYLKINTIIIQSAKRFIQIHKLSILSSFNPTHRQNNLNFQARLWNFRTVFFVTQLPCSSGDCRLKKAVAFFMLQSPHTKNKIKQQQTKGEKVKEWRGNIENGNKSVMQDDPRFLQLLQLTSCS